MPRIYPTERRPSGRPVVAGTHVARGFRPAREGPAGSKDPALPTYGDRVAPRRAVAGRIPAGRRHGVDAVAPARSLGADAHMVRTEHLPVHVRDDGLIAGDAERARGQSGH